MARTTSTAEQPGTTGLVVAGDRPSEVVAFEIQMVDFFVAAATLLGVPKSVAAIYGIVFASPAPLSFGDIEQRLNLSKGSVSQGLRVLRDVGALKEVSSDSDRTALFEPDLQMRKLVQRFIEQRLEKQLTAGRGRLDALERSVPGSASEAAIVKHRLKSLADWNNKARTLLPVVRTILKLGA